MGSIQGDTASHSGDPAPAILSKWKLGGHHPAWWRSRRMTWGLCPAPARAFTTHTANSSASCLGYSQPRHVSASEETRAKYSFHACDKNRMPSTEQSVTLQLGFTGRVNPGEEEQGAGQRPQLAWPCSAGTKPHCAWETTLLLHFCVAIISTLLCSNAFCSVVKSAFLSQDKGNQEKSFCLW